MSDAPTFVPITGGRLFALSTTATAAVPGFWAGYCAAPGTTLAGTLTTTEAWQDPAGTYLFLGATPSDWTAFLAGFDSLRPVIAPPGRLRFLWIDNPDEPTVGWRLTAIQATASGSGSAIDWKTLRATGFRLGHYGLDVAGQGTLRQLPDADGGGVGFAGGGTFIGPAGQAPFTAGTLAIPFDGPEVASLVASFTAPPAASDGSGSLWDAFTIGLRYAAPPAVLVDTSAAPAGTLAVQGATRLLAMPVFAGQAMPLPVALAYDPVAPLVGRRTYLSLAPAIAAGAPALSSYLRTTLGYPITLTPLAATTGIPDARFVFGAAPVAGDDRPDGVSYHLSPEGAFALTVVPPSGVTATRFQLLTGLSGLEYVEIARAQHQLVLTGGRPAFATPADPTRINAPTLAEALTATATTSHATVMPLSGTAAAVYYAQPRQAPIFSGHTQIAPGFLDFNPMPAATLTPGPAPASFPIGVYAGIAADAAVLARELESASIAPYRHHRIDTGYNARSTASDPMSAHGPLKRPRADADPLGVTPQGLIVELTPDYRDFDGLYVGHMPGTAHPRIDFTVVRAGLKTALQSNQLFFVAANVDTLMQATSVRYALAPTDLNAELLRGRGVPQTIIDAVYQALAGKPQPFDTEAAFVACIGTPATPAYLPAFLTLAGLLQVEMDGWTFQLSPRAWRPWEPTGLGVGTDAIASPTLMIAKFCNRPLSALAADTSAWVWPEVAVPPKRGGNIGDTQRVLLDILDRAAATEVGSPYRRFLTEVADNPAWNGFLFLNAPVDVAQMPPDLLFLTAGIDTDRFYAHHVGLSQTPFTVDGTTPTLGSTAAFGLIDYDDPVDLYAEQTVAFDFKTLQLRARFANSALADFSARAELLTNRLFSDVLTKQAASHGNNLVLDGGYQRVGGTPVYSFVLAGRNSYSTRASVLSTVEVGTVALQTRGAGAAGQIVAEFTLSGTLQFGMPQLFDLYSYGPPSGAIDAATAAGVGLRYTGLSVTMAFALGGSGDKTFSVLEGNLSFDVPNSVTRAQSLVAHFPLTLTGLVAALPTTTDDGGATTMTGTRPEDLGYVSVSAPLDQTPLTSPWYGLRFALDLGTLGALIGSIGIGVEVLAAWQPGKDAQSTPPQYLGLKLSTGPAANVSWPLQGVLSLGFRGFQFLTYIDEHEALVYLLRLHQFTLSVLGLLNFPPGNNDIVLFGNPDQSGSSKLGWYAAYAADAKEAKTIAARPGARRLAGPRTATGPEAIAPGTDGRDRFRTERSRRSGRRQPAGRA